jgi:glycosyltransferase involved in cell wall biosynthesis
VGALPDVTVVIPTRNRADLLSTTLHSIQVAADEARRAGWTTHVLVVDDCSDDTSTRDVCAAAGAECVRIEEHDGRNNPASAIVLGVANARSRFIMLFGDDDIMLPRHLVAHLEVAESGYDLCSGSYHLTDADLRVVSTAVLPQPTIEDLLDGRVTINDGALVRTDLFQAGPWDPTLDQVVILPVWLTLMTQGVRATTIAEPTWLYRRHHANISDALPPEDREQRSRVIDVFRQAYLDRGERVPASVAQIRRDETEAYAEQARRRAVLSAAAAAEEAERKRVAREAWNATPRWRRAIARAQRRLHRG